MYQGRGKEKKKTIQKELLTIAIIFGIINLPFLTITQYAGLEVVLDSFNNPSDYKYLKIDNENLKPEVSKNQYLILQKPTHPEFTLKNGDHLLFMDYDGELLCNEIDYIKKIGNIKRIYFKTDPGDEENQPIFLDYVIGKILFTADNNPWNTLSLQTWDTSVNTLNLHALFNK